MPRSACQPSLFAPAHGASVPVVSSTVGEERPQRFQAAEFFAGIGLVRQALSAAGIGVAWANDIEPVKAAMYAANYPSDHYVVGDVRDTRGWNLPDIDVATASFPCTDLSLAGARRGLAGEQSGMFWEFARVIEEMENRRPPLLMLENVPGFASSRGGNDLRDAVAKLNDLGYSCDIFQVDARNFAPQSRLRLFIIGSREPLGPRPTKVDPVRPQYLVDFANTHASLDLHALPLTLPRPDHRTLADVVERIEPGSPLWWDEIRTQRFLWSLSPIQVERLRTLTHDERMAWRTAYRRTRHGVAVWEIRADAISGCLRTARGGSSKQAVDDVKEGTIRVRWMTAREYARLQGVSDEFDFAGLSRNQVMFGFGDAVCVPVVSWIARTYLAQALRRMAGTASLTG